MLDVTGPLYKPLATRARDDRETLTIHPVRNEGMNDATDAERLLAHVLVPVANEADARATAGALTPYDPQRITLLHVVEKGGGVPDKTPVEQSEDIAERSFEAFRETFPEAAGELRYDRDVVGAICAAADDVGASAIAFRPREGGRIERLLSGDLSQKLLDRADRPVVGLPTEEAG
jgi:nucleotide-binding universal stress UspA family protein